MQIYYCYRLVYNTMMELGDFLAPIWSSNELLNRAVEWLSLLAQSEEQMVGLQYCNILIPRVDTLVIEFFFLIWLAYSGAKLNHNV